MKKILLVEDEESKNFRPISKLKKKYDVTIVISIKAAIKAWKRSKDFDLVILDIMMGWGPYSEKETDEGTETGWVFYKEELRESKVKVLVWTRNNDIFNKKWDKDNVKLAMKTGEDDELINEVKWLIGE